MEDFVALQGRYCEVLQSGLALGEDNAFGAGLGVRKAYSGVMPQLRKIGSEQLWAVMLRSAGNVKVTVWKRRFNKQQVNSLEPVKPVPEAVICRGIPTEGEHSALALDAVADGGNDVVNWY